MDTGVQVLFGELSLTGSAIAQHINQREDFIQLGVPPGGCRHGSV
jgi:hypothetical protein